MNWLVRPRSHDPPPDPGMESRSPEPPGLREVEGRSCTHKNLLSCYLKKEEAMLGSRYDRRPLQSLRKVKSFISRSEADAGPSGLLAGGGDEVQKGDVSCSASHSRVRVRTSVRFLLIAVGYFPYP